MGLSKGAARRGRHRSTDKEGRQTLARLERIDGVAAVIISRSIGGKSIGRRRGVGDFKLQGEVAGGFKGVLQTSKGIQEIFVKVAVFCLPERIIRLPAPTYIPFKAPQVAIVPSAWS